MRERDDVTPVTAEDAGVRCESASQVGCLPSLQLTKRCFKYCCFAPLAYLALDDLGRIVDINRYGADLLGRDGRQLLQAPLADFVALADHAAWQNLWTRALQQDARVSGELRLQRDDDSCVDIRLDFQRMIEPGEPLRVRAALTDIGACTRVENELRKSEALLNATGWIAKIGGWALEVDTQEVTWSAEVYRIHEIVADRPPPFAQCVDFYAPEARPVLIAALKDCIATGAPIDLELPFVTAQGRSLWVGVQGQAEFECGRIARLIGSFQDITARRRAEDELKESYARFERAVRGSTDGIWDWNFLRGEGYFSARWFELLGYFKDEFKPVFAHWRELLHPDDYERVLGGGLAQIELRKPHDVEFRMRHKTGEYRWYCARGQGEWDAQGALIRLSGSFSDITERKQTEEALRKSEERLAMALKGATDGYWDWDWIGRRFYCSPRCLEIGGYVVGELNVDVGICREAMHPDDYKRVMSWLEAFLQSSDEEHFEVSARYRHKDGHYVPVICRGLIRRNEVGRPIRLSGTLTDATKREKAEQRRLAQARLQRDALVREVHHRIKNHLQGLAGLLRRHAQKQPTLTAFVDQMVSQISAIAVVHGLQGKHLNGRIRLRQTIADIVTFYRRSGAVVFECRAQSESNEWILNEDAAVSVALIVNELIANAQRHGVPGDDEAVQVHLDCGTECCRLQVLNAGRLPPGFDFVDAVGLGTGLELVQALMPHYGAQLKILAATIDRVEASLQLMPPVVIDERAVPSAPTFAA